MITTKVNIKASMIVFMFCNFSSFLYELKSKCIKQ